jgi:hypothetical protein
MEVVLIIFAALAVAGAVAAVRTAARDGYRRIPTRYV